MIVDIHTASTTNPFETKGFFSISRVCKGKLKSWTVPNFAAATIVYDTILRKSVEKGLVPFTIALNSNDILIDEAYLQVKRSVVLPQGAPLPTQCDPVLPVSWTVRTLHIAE